MSNFWDATLQDLLKQQIWQPQTLLSRQAMQGMHITAICFSSEGGFLAAAAHKEVGKSNNLEMRGSVRLWDTRNGKLQCQLAIDTGVSQIAVSRDGKILATSWASQSVRLWDARTGKYLRSLKLYGTSIFAIAFSPDGKILVSVSTDQKARLWNVATGKVIRTLPHDEMISDIAFSPDGKTLYIAATSGFIDAFIGGAKIWQWSFPGGQLQKTRSIYSNATVNSTDNAFDGQTLASTTSDSTIRLWDTQTGVLLWTVVSPKYQALSYAFSPDGTTVAIGGNDKLVRFCDKRTGKLRQTLTCNGDLIESIAFTPDGKTLATGSWDGGVQLWRIK